MPSIAPAPLPVPVSPVPAHLTTGQFAIPSVRGYGAATTSATPPVPSTADPTQAPMSAQSSGNYPAQPGFSPPAGPHTTGSFAAKPTTGGFASVPPGASRITVQMPEPGMVLTSTRGQYVVSSVLGNGEFGAVFECTGPFDQSYALKVIRPANRPYAEVQAEWAREVSRLMSLRHPNVVYIYDAFEQGSLFFLALEKCDHAMKSMLGAPMQEGLVLELARQLLAAVQFLHDNDVVHDDLHAGNVLVTHATDRPVLKISDFGISHELRGLPAIRPNVVHHAIMAPEILATGYTSKQSDLYQVGLLLYWMLTGASAIPSGLPYAELVRYVAEGEPRRCAEALGTPVALLVAKMLRRREAFRYSSAREVWSELRELRTWKERQLFPQR
jgi:serine/threonine-protein kinase